MTAALHFFSDPIFTSKFAGAVFIALGTVVAARLSAVWVSHLSRRTEHRLFSNSLYCTLVQVIVGIVGLLTILSTLGIRIEAILTTLGVGGLAVALALNDALSNLFAGIQIITAHQLRVGDYVKFDFAEGEVTDIQWHNTMLRDAQNDIVVIPNAKVNTSPYTNYSRTQRGVVLPVTATLPWKGSFAALQRIAADAAGGAPVRLTAINETNVQVTAYLPTKHYAQRSQVAASFLERLHDAALDAKMGVPG